MARKATKSGKTRTVKARRRPAPRAPDHTDTIAPQHVAGMRELFWQNVMREMLTSLSMVSALRPADAPRSTKLVERAGTEHAPEPRPEAPPGATLVSSAGTEVQQEGDHYQPELFDGRLAVILKNGERVPIAEVFPVFACGVNTPESRPLAMAVECSVFQIRTPQGQVFTLPLHEMRGFHALTPELIKRIAAAARSKNRRAEAPEGMPFGFAAFTSLARGASELLVPQAPDNPTE